MNNDKPPFSKFQLLSNNIRAAFHPRWLEWLVAGIGWTLLFFSYESTLSPLVFLLWLILCIGFAILVFALLLEDQSRKEWAKQTHQFNFPQESTTQGQGYVYILRDVEISYLYKIGKTNHLRRRLDDFGVMLPFATEVVHLIPCQHPSKLEAVLHRAFAHKRRRGEWFALDPADLEWIRSQAFEQ